MTEFLTTQKVEGALEVSLRSDWVFDNIPQLSEALETITADSSSFVQFKCGGLKELDLSGAWLLYDKSLDIEYEGGKTDFDGFKAAHFKFLQHIIDVAAVNEYIPGFFDKKPGHFWRDSMETIGRNSIEAVESVGYIAQAVLDGARKPSRLVIGETIRQIHATGVAAIPIVMVVCFLMGVVLAYQSARQLEQFGANIFMVDLVANSIFRELGVLLASIMVADDRDPHLPPHWAP